MIVAVPVTDDGLIGPAWGRAEKVAIADVVGDGISGWTEYPVGWNDLHDTGTEGSHHARIARFLIDHKVEMVVSGHMGPPMQMMLSRMGIRVRLGAQGNARQAVEEHQKALG
jgi:predicted Fe-Mo cluster-binding NifX family protein